VKASLQPWRRHCFAALTIVVGVSGALAAQSAFAVLGGNPLTAPEGSLSTSSKSVARAAVAVSGASSASTSNYTVQSTTLANGTVINEYLSAQGTVFGVAWHGPSVPNLAALLGSYFPQYQQDLQTQRAARGGRGPVSVQGTGLVVNSGGHMGAFSGNAYLPQSLPAGVSASDIQ
jgi:hypothetical protein